MPHLQLKADHITKSFRTGLFSRQGKKILNNISFMLQKGETYGIMGESGTGKTTLGKILAGLEPPSSRNIFYGENCLNKMEKDQYTLFRRKVQMVFQNPESALNPRKSISRSLTEVLHLKNIPKNLYEESINLALNTVGLSEDFLCRYPHQLSGGQNQRIVLARVLLLEPEFIILDEPTSSLDPSVSAQILHLLKKLQKEKEFGYLFISHHKDVVSFMAHRIGVLKNGVLNG